jgi:phage baseplate assembly protein V
MNAQLLYDLLAQVIRVGFVCGRDPARLRVRVELRDTTGGSTVSDWLQVLAPRARDDCQYDLPDIEDQVLCLFLPIGKECGFVLGGMYADEAPPVSSGDKWHRLFKDGTVLEYDRKEHVLLADVQGRAEVHATGDITATAGTFIMAEAGTEISGLAGTNASIQAGANLSAGAALAAVVSAQTVDALAATNLSATAGVMASIIAPQINLLGALMVGGPGGASAPGNFTGDITINGNLAVSGNSSVGGNSNAASRSGGRIP